MKILCGLLSLLIGLNLLFAQSASINILKKYDSLSKKEKKNFIRVGKDSVGNSYYLFNQKLDSFYSYDKKALYIIYVQIFNPNFIYPNPFSSSKDTIKFKNVKTICRWVVDFQSNSYYISQYKTFDSSMKYITGDSNDVYIWKYPDKQTIEYNILKCAKESFK